MQTEEANSNSDESKWFYYHNSHSDSFFPSIFLCSGWCSEPFLPIISIMLSLSASKPGRARTAVVMTDGNKAEDGATEWGGAKQAVWPGIRCHHFSQLWQGIVNFKWRKWQLEGFSSFQVCLPLHYGARLSLSTSFGQDYKLNMAAHHTSGDAVKF